VAHPQSFCFAFKRNRSCSPAGDVGHPPLEGLKEPCNVKLHSDSRYVIDGITKWIHGWKRRNWTRNGWKAKEENKTRLVINAGLWQRLDAARARHDVEWIWVKGHAGTSENERCDVLAEAAARRASS